MQTIFILSLLVNVGIAGLVLYKLYPRVIKHIKDKKKQRETQRKIQETKRVRKIVREYLEELQGE